MWEDLLNKLTPKEREIFRALETQEHKGLAEMYLGAKMCWLDEKHPERMAITAHCLREFCEKLRRNKNHPSLGDLVRKIAPKYLKIREDLILAFNQKEHTDNLRTVIEMLDALSNYEQDNLKSKKSQIEGFVKTHRNIDLPVTSLITSEWKNSEDYFTDVAHHRIGTTAVEMEETLNRLENLLLPLIKPQRTGNILEMLRKVKEIENDLKK